MGEDVTGPPPGLTVSGSFAIVSPIDLTVGAVVPAQIAQAVDVLRQLRDDPGPAFFDLLDEADVPLVSELRAVLPDALENKVGGWITQAITAPFRDELDAILEVADRSLTRFDLLSDLDLPAPDTAGKSRATHGLRGLRFTVAGKSVEILGSIAVSASVDAMITRSSSGADATLALGPHAFGLAYGELAYALLDRSVEERHGAGLRETLGALANCPAVAAEVAGRCLLSVCVGHEAELEALCEKGLDAAVARIHDELASIRFNAVTLRAGSAALWDTRSDGGIEDAVLDRITSGTWNGTLDLGMGPRQVPATFSGTRN